MKEVQEFGHQVRQDGFVDREPECLRLWRVFDISFDIFHAIPERVVMRCGTRFWGYPYEAGFAAWRGRFFGTGEIRLALLSLVAEGPSHGYELMKKLEERAGGV